MTLPLVALVHAYIRTRVQRRELAPRTAVSVRNNLLTFARTYGARPVRNLSRRDIDRWLATRSHVAPGTYRNDVVRVRGFCAWLAAERHIQRNPLAGMSVPPVPRAVPRSLPGDEIDALLRVLPDLRARAIIAMLYDLAMRRDEVRRAQVGDWDRRAALITITGKGGHMRLVHVPPNVAAILDAYLAETGATAGPLIRRTDGTAGISANHLGDLVRQWMQAARIKTRPRDGKACHSLRHTGATELADVEPDLRVIQQYLGHRALGSTQIYTSRVNLGRMRTAMEARFEARQGGVAQLYGAA